MPQKILIVDDEPNIVIPLQFLMEQNGYLTRVAQSGEEALEMISKEKPDLVLLDIMLPGADGLEICKRLKSNAHSQHIPIIMLTSLSAVG